MYIYIYIYIYIYACERGCVRAYAHAARSRVRSWARLLISNDVRVNVDLRAGRSSSPRYHRAARPYFANLHLDISSREHRKPRVYLRRPRGILRAQKPGGFFLRYFRELIANTLYTVRSVHVINSIILVHVWKISSVEIISIRLI